MGAWSGLKLGQNLATPLLWEVWEWQGIAGAQFQKDAGVPENQNRLYSSIKKNDNLSRPALFHEEILLYTSVTAAYLTSPRWEWQEKLERGGLEDSAAGVGDMP